MSIIKNVSDYFKKSPVKFIGWAILIIFGLIFAPYIAVSLIIILYLWNRFKKEEEKQKGTKKVCPHCKTEIDSGASICPHCHGKMYIWTAQKKITFAIIILLVLVGITKISSSSVSTPSVSNTASTPSPIDSASKEEAQKELDDFMALSKKAGLVTSYEFSESANVVFVGSVWYTQTVQFKKDFIAKVGTLKKSITGYTHFEVRDAYSNEKVGELTAFSQSIEVYK